MVTIHVNFFLLPSLNFSAILHTKFFTMAGKSLIHETTILQLSSLAWLRTSLTFFLKNLRFCFSSFNLIIRYTILIWSFSESKKDPLINWNIVLQDEAKKAELQKKFNEEVLPNLFKALEKRLGERGGEYMAANKLSWADIILYHFAAELPDKEVIKGYSKLDALFNKVAELPKIKSWVARRPASAV